MAGGSTTVDCITKQMLHLVKSSTGDMGAYRLKKAAVLMGIMSVTKELA